MTTIGTMPMNETSILTESAGKRIEDPLPDHRRNCHSPLEQSPLLSPNLGLSAIAGASPLNLSLMTASILHRAIKPLARRSSSPTQTRSDTDITAPSIYPDNSVATSSLLSAIPKDVLSSHILGFLTDKAVKTFLDSLGEERLKSPSYSDLRNQFCPLHGSRLEDPDAFVVNGVNNNDSSNSPFPKITKTKVSKKRCCPECYATQQNTKRCNGCQVFYPRYRDPSNNQAFPGLWCQECDKMAFCNSCLTNEDDGCGSKVKEKSFNIGPFFGRKRLQGGCGRGYCSSGRISCINYCCPNVFTNTMCGEFVCYDCADERQRILRTQTTAADSDEMAVQTCDECGKATCLDPNCLVCNDFRMIHLSCKFCPEDAYKVDLGGILFGSKSNGSNTNLANKLRRNFSDGMVWIFVFFALYKMWWYQKQHQEEHVLQYPQNYYEL